MEHIQYQNNRLCLDGVALNDIASEIGTPCYVYSQTAITEAWDQFAHTLGTPERIHYAVKANSNVHILQLLANKGSGFDVVSGGELHRVLMAKGNPKSVVFSGVGKTQAEIETALEAGIGCLHVESAAELYRIQDIARAKNKMARVALRVNPDVDPNSHPYISTGLRNNKFGIEQALAKTLVMEAQHASHVQIIGFACHIGSQITTLAPFLEAADKVLALTDELNSQGLALSYLNLGGGLGVRYELDEPVVEPSEYIAALKQKMGSRALELHLEPGRALVANAGVLLTQVEYLKETESQHWLIIDAGMTELIRPSLYQAWHRVLPLNEPTSGTTLQTVDIAGPVCESSDVMARARALAVQAGDRLAICSAGAYGFCMSSNYNSRLRPAEVLVDGKTWKIIRQRETLADLVRGEVF